MKRRLLKLKRSIFILHPSSFILVFMLCVDAWAMPLEDYRARVAAADAAMSRLLELYGPAKDDEPQAATSQFKNEETKTLRELRAALPVTEKVEWAGSTLDVNNGWLQTDLDAYEQLPAVP